MSGAVLLLAKATLVLGVALVATRLLARAAAGTRHLVWVATLAGLLVVPALATWAPLRLAILPPPREVVRVVESPRADAPSADAADPVAPLDAPDAATSRVAAPIPQGDLRTGAVSVPGSPFAGIAPRTLLLGAWALGALGVLAWLAHGAWAVRRIVRGATPLAGREWTDLLYDAADRLGLDDVPRLVRSDAVRMPFASGLHAPVIVLPAASDAWAPARRRAVLLHELAHVARRDMAWHLLARLACAAWWFHPLAWVAARRLRAESEQACDDLALAVGTPAADYAEHLLEIVVRVRHDAVPALAIAMARRSEFEGRMLAILDPDRPRTTPRRAQAGAIVAALALPVLVIGAAAPVAAGSPASATVPRVASGEARTALPADGDRAQPATASGTFPLRDLPDGTAAETVRVDWRDAVREGSRRDAFRLRDSLVDLAATERGLALAESARERARAIAEARVEAGAWAGVGAGAASGVDGAAIAESAMRAGLAAAQGSIAQLLRDDDRHGRLDPVARIALLVKLLRADTSATVRRLAAWGLADHARERTANGALAQAVTADADASVREMAAWALADGDDDREGIAALARAVRGDRDAGVRATAAWALGSIGEDDEAARAALVAALRDADPRVRTRAIWAIGSLDADRAPAELFPFLRDTAPRVRELTAWALASIGDVAAARPLVQALEGERDARQRRLLVRALASLDEPPVAMLEELLASPDTALRQVAVRALTGRGNGAGAWPWPWPQPRPFPK